MGGAGVTITAHALVRYMERVLGMPMDACRRAVSPSLPQSVGDSELLRAIEREVPGLLALIRSEMRKAIAPFLDAGAISAKIADFVIPLDPQTRTVITVIDRGTRPKRYRQRGGQKNLRTLSRLGATG